MKAKNKAKQAKAQKPKKQQNKTQNVTRSKSAEYANLLLNPDYAPISGSFQLGESGIIQRFHKDYVINTGATDTAGFFAFLPCQNAVSFYSTVAGSSAISVSYQFNNSYSPGSDNLGFCSRIRGLAAKVEVLPIGATADSMTGEFGAGNVSGYALQLNTTCDMMFRNTTARDVLVKKPYTVVFKPGKADHEFTGPAENYDSTDTNALFVVWRGAPAGKAITIRLTTVMEWTPKTVSDVSHTTTANPTPVDTHRVVAAMDAKHGHWWHDLKTGVLKDVSTVARYGVRAGLTYVTQHAHNTLFGAARAAPLLLTA